MQEPSVYLILVTNESHFSKNVISITRHNLVILQRIQHRDFLYIKDTFDANFLQRIIKIKKSSSYH